eukprot:Rmarinus@m.9430
MADLVYLDHAASTPPYPEVSDAMIKWMSEGFANPSARHVLGAKALQAIDESRRKLASAFGITEKDVVFTSGSTESNNLAIFGMARALKAHGRHVLLGPSEHSSARLPTLALREEGFEVEEITMTSTGKLDVDTFRKQLRKDTVLVVQMLVNNTSGAITPISDMAKVMQTVCPKARLHCDCTQGVGKVSFTMPTLGAHTASISGHKFGGPRGAGALLLSTGLTPTPKPLLLGGGQESGLRAGTENTAGIVGLGIAVETATRSLAQNVSHYRRLRKVLIDGIRSTPGLTVLPDSAALGGSGEGGAEDGVPTVKSRWAPHVVALKVPKVPAEVYALHLEELGVLVSVGSACQSKKSEINPAFLMLGLSEAEARQVIRVSFGLTSTEAHVRALCAALEKAVKKLTSEKLSDAPAPVEPAATPAPAPSSMKAESGAEPSGVCAGGEGSARKGPFIEVDVAALRREIENEGPMPCPLSAKPAAGTKGEASPAEPAAKRRKVQEDGDGDAAMNDGEGDQGGDDEAGEKGGLRKKGGKKGKKGKKGKDKPKEMQPDEQEICRRDPRLPEASTPLSLEAATNAVSALPDGILVIFAELTLKKNNARMFEIQLLHNIQDAVNALVPCRITHRHRHMVVEPKDPENKHRMDDLVKVIACIPGIMWVSPVWRTTLDMESVQWVGTAVTRRAVEALGRSCTEEPKEQITFRTHGNFTGGSRGSVPFTRMPTKELEVQLADAIISQFHKGMFKVQLKDPQITLRARVFSGGVYVYTEQIRGAAGLPVGTGGKAIVLLSGGIDSPVAAYMAMRRGLSVTYVMFHSYPYLGESSKRKIESLVRQLARYQPKSKLIIVPFAKCQETIRDHCCEPYRTVLYRRMMQRIANHICRLEHARAVVTGESLGQVASQTVQNMYCIGAASDFLLFRPLVGIDKIETVDMARKIGTYDISIINEPDCCVVFQPKGPVIHGNLATCLEEEAKIPDMDKLVGDAVGGREMRSVTP